VSFPEHFDWEPPDPPVDEAVTVRCTNPECFMFEEYEDEPSREVFGGQWHPTTESEYQGVSPHGGMVDFYTDDAFTCPECGEEGEEVA
jgi:hypothetical protein